MSDFDSDLLYHMLLQSYKLNKKFDENDVTSFFKNTNIKIIEYPCLIKDKNDADPKKFILHYQEKN